MRILIVEDELLVAKGLSEILEARGFEITDNVTSVEDALISINTIEPNIVLLDISLNGTKDGIDLGRELKSRFNIPFIYITSYSDNITFERAKITNPYAYITKPFKEMDVILATDLAISNYINKEESRQNSTDQSSPVPGMEIRKIRAYVLAHLHDTIKLSHLAETVGLNVHHFSHYFKKVAGIAPYEYVIQLRLEVAEDLIVNTSEPLAQIAYATGFSNQSQMTKHFKVKYKLTPAKYRKRKLK